MQPSTTVVTMMIAANWSLAMTVDAAEEIAPPWVESMREVHDTFTGRSGTVALFGDSITVSLAFWAPLAGESQGASPEMAEALDAVRRHQHPECWREWRGPDFGNNGGMTIRWAHENVGKWLEKLNPEVAVIMFGTNDLTQLELEEYEQKTREVVERILDNGTVALLTTLPPRHGLADKAADFADALRQIAKDLKVPLIDYHAEILRRRPSDWDGSLPRFREALEADASEYDVPTLIAGDGVHPSNPRSFQDYSSTSLSANGYLLRSYLTLIAYAEVIQTVLKPASKPGDGKDAN